MRTARSAAGRRSINGVRDGRVPRIGNDTYLRGAGHNPAQVGVGQAEGEAEYAGRADRDFQRLGDRLKDDRARAGVPRGLRGVGEHRGGWVSLDEARALGYEPADDAERFAAEVIAEHGEPDPADPLLAHLGGVFCLPAYDADRL